MYSDGSQLRDHKNAKHYVTRLSYFRQLVVNGGTKYIPKTRYLISWWSPFPQKHSSNRLKPWSTNFPVYILKIKVRERLSNGIHKAYPAITCRHDAEEENWKPLFIRCIVQCKDSPVYHIPHGWEAGNATIWLMFLQNDSIWERVYPWRSVRTRWSCESGCDQADALTDLLNVLCNTLSNDLFWFSYFILFDLSLV